MKNRITIAELETIVYRINLALNAPETPYTTKKNGLKANVGNYHLDGAYGGYALHCMTNTSGGIKDIFCGHYPKKELYSKLKSFLGGIYTAKGIN